MKGRKQTLQLIDFVESVQQSDALEVDMEAGIIRNVKFLGYQSPNRHGRTDVEGTEYLREGVREALPLYEGTQVFIDHPTDRKKPGAERSTRDLAGFLVECRDEDDGGFSNIECTKGTPAGDLLLALALRCPAKIGLSHNAGGKGYVDRSRKKHMIESIPVVRSVDVVTRPATTRNLYESQESPMAGKTIKEIIADRKWKKGDVILKLLEDDAMGMDTAAPPPPMEDELDWRGHIKQAVAKVLDDTELDEDQVKKKISAFLKTLKDEEPAAEEETETPPEEEETEGAVKESIEDKVNRLERLNDVRNLCESLDYIAKGDELEALMAVANDKARRGLIATFKKAATPPAPKPGVRSTSARTVALRESQGDTTKPAKDRTSFLSRITGGRVKPSKN